MSRLLVPSVPNSKAIQHNTEASNVRVRTEGQSNLLPWWPLSGIVSWFVEDRLLIASQQRDHYPYARHTTMPSKALWALAAATGVLAVSLGVLIAETVYVVRTTPILPPPEGPRQGTITRPTPTDIPASTTTTTTATTPHRYRLLLIGDSSIQGIGVEHTTDALPHQLALALADTLAAAGESCEVEWAMIGKTGYRAADMLLLLRHIPLSFLTPSTTPTTTLVVLGCGVNHIARLHTQHRFERELSTLITAIRSTLPTSPSAVPVFLVGLPPMHAFPLPFPLRSLLGWKARQLNGSLARLAHTVPDVTAISALELFTPAALHNIKQLWHPTVAAKVRHWYGSKGWVGKDGDGVGFPLDASVLFRDMLARDGYHPNAHGASIMAAIAVLPLVDWIRRHRPADTTLHSRL